MTVADESAGRIKIKSVLGICSRKKAWLWGYVDTCWSRFLEVESWSWVSQMGDKWVSSVSGSAQQSQSFKGLRHVASPNAGVGKANKTAVIVGETRSLCSAHPGWIGGQWQKWIVTKRTALLPCSKIYCGYFISFFYFIYSQNVKI